MTVNYNLYKKTLEMSFKLAFKWNIFKWLSTLGLGSLVGFFLNGKIFNLIEIKTYYGAIISIISVYLLRFFFIAFKETINFFHFTYKESVYGNTIILLKQGFAEANYHKSKESTNDEDLLKSMIILCNKLKESFDQITKSKCCVSIKIPVKDLKVESNTILKNITRDSSNTHRDTKKYEEIKHTIIGNSAFTHCLDGVVRNIDSKHYLNNDVNNENNYKNTSKACYEDGKLPYNSELVYPIVPIKNRDNNNYDCRGFICVDSDKKNAFEDKYGSSIISGVADGIYDLIIQFNSLKNGN